MDGWMERWMALRQKQREEMTTGIMELRFCIASLTRMILKGLCIFEVEFIKINIPHIISKILNILCLIYKPDSAFFKIQFFIWQTYIKKYNSKSQ